MARGKKTSCQTKGEMISCSVAESRYKEPVEPNNTNIIEILGDFVAFEEKMFDSLKIPSDRIKRNSYQQSLADLMEKREADLFVQIETYAQEHYEYFLTDEQTIGSLTKSQRKRVNSLLSDVL